MPKLVRDLSPAERAEWVSRYPEFTHVPDTHPINRVLAWGDHILPDALWPLARYDRWVVWRWTPRADRPEKLDKPPFIAASGMRHAANNNPDDWRDYSHAKDYVNGGLAHGAGFVITGSNVCAFDLDHCFDATGTLYPTARALVERCGSYTEWTPSGAGLRILGTDVIGQKRQCTMTMPEGWSLEAYEAGCTRYITVTGQVFEGYAGPVANIGAMMADAFKGQESRSSSTEPREGPLDWAKFRSAVMAIPNDGRAAGVANWDRGLDRDTVWVPLGACIYRTGHPQGWELFLEFSEQSPKFRARETKRVWRSFERNPTASSGKVWTPATVYWIAMQNGWDELGPIVETVTAVTEQDLIALYPRWMVS